MRIFEGAANPINIVSAIDWDQNVYFAKTPSGTSYSLLTTHDCFPAHEVYVGSQAIYTFQPANYSFINTITPRRSDGHPEVKRLAQERFSMSLKYVSFFIVIAVLAAPLDGPISTGDTSRKNMVQTQRLTSTRFLLSF
ncbi:MAG: hypothetical protein U5J83_14390 [Bryobacterales bacterium]|nr:hypothetical protein [Bryobacterales bacterium]